jgi:two-component system NtrC family sensor kinase
MEDSEGSGKARPRALRSRLAWRFGLGLCLGAAAILVVAGIWNVRLQRKHMTGLIRTSADRIAETIRRSTRDAMQRNRPEEVHRILETIGAQPGIERIRIFDGQGRITISTRPEEVGRFVDNNAEQCYVCHAADRPLQHIDSPDRMRIFQHGEAEGQRVLGIIAPIHNEPTCATADCHAHADDQQVLGVLDVQLSLAPVDEQLAQSEWQMGIGLLFTVAAVLALAGFLIWLLVLRPVRALTKATVQVGAGDLTLRLPVTSDDEIGYLEHSWNRMLEELARVRREREQWSHTLEQRVEEKTRELELAHQRMLVVEKMASLGKLAAVVAHEINNPLAAIATYARVLRRQRGDEAKAGSGDGEAEKVLALVEEEARRCGDIVRNLLVFSRAAAASFAEEEVGPLLERCVLLLKHKAKLQGVEIRLDVASDLPAIVCDASQIQQIVLALAMNAIEAMARDGTLTIRAARDGTGREIVLTVADTGRGIPAAQLDRIFEPFYTTKEKGSGVGLGLAVVYGIVSRHHGRIEVDSTPGTGTVFTIHLPVAQPADAGAAPETEGGT